LNGRRQRCRRVRLGSPPGTGGLSATTVNNGATLGGNGTVSGLVTIASGGTLHRAAAAYVSGYKETVAEAQLRSALPQAGFDGLCPRPDAPTQKPLVLVLGPVLNRHGAR